MRVFVCRALAVSAICEEGLQYPVPVCHCTSCCWCPRSQLPPSPAHPVLEWMTPGTPEDSHLAVAPLHFSLPLKHNSELSHHSPNKRYSSCIFNLLTDAIILYTPCSLILMQLLLFIAGKFFPPIISFESASLSMCVCVCVCAHLCADTKAVGPIRAGQWQS